MQNINNYQKDQATIFEKKLNEYVRLRNQQALDSVNEYQRQQAEYFEKKLNLYKDSLEQKKK